MSEKSPQEEELTRLGRLALIPFGVGAAVMWLSPWLAPQSIAMEIHHIVLPYAAVIAAFLAGSAAGAELIPKLGPPQSFLPPILAALAAWLVVWQGHPFLYIGPAWRYLIIIALFIYLLLRDLAAVRAELLPRWYGELRKYLTFWATMALLLMMSRLLLWGHS